MDLGDVVIEINGDEVTLPALTSLKDYLARDVSEHDKIMKDRKAQMDAYRDLAKPIKKRISKFAQAIKAGCVTAADYNQWAMSGEPGK